MTPTGPTAARATPTPATTGPRASRWRKAPLFWLALAAAGCATLATETAFPGAITTSGVGPFRGLERYETGIFRNPSGQAFDATGVAVESGGVAGDRLFYAAAAPLSEPPERAADLPAYATDWAQTEGRAIYRASPGGFTGTLDGAEVTLPGFAPGEVVLSASEAWEGAELYDPCPVLLADGRLRLYYAAAGGIGVAEAPSVDGALTRVGSGPILAPDPAIHGGATPRSPAVVELEGMTYLYYDAGDGVRVARSDDGLSFTPVDADETTAEVDPIFTTLLMPRPDDPVELVAGMPGATLATMPGGRRVVRVYYELARDDGSRVVSVSASVDGVNFERYGAASFDVGDPGAPRPWLRDDGATLLLTHASREAGGVQAGALVLSITPAAQHLADEPE